MHPIKRAPVQVHYSCDKEHILANAVDNRAGEAAKVQFAVLASDFSPAGGLLEYSLEGGLIFGKKNRRPTLAIVLGTNAQRPPIPAELQDGG